MSEPRSRRLAAEASELRRWEESDPSPAVADDRMLLGRQARGGGRASGARGGGQDPTTLTPPSNGAGGARSSGG